MLAAIGVDSTAELFEQIPEPLRLGRPLALPDGLSEAEVYERLAGLAGRNADAEAEVCFVGAGMYDHYVPAIVDAITSRSEFLTPYTPYQPEISQGGLQVMFEFQTAMSELTGLPVSNAGLYEGPSSVASAGYLAMGATKRRRFVVSRGVHPHSRETLATYSEGYGAEIVEVGLEGGVTDAAALAAAVDGETAAVILQSPNFLGAVEDVEALGAAAKEHGALLVVACDPMTLGILKPPGECGADIALGEGQPLGNRLDFGGPSFGFFCATEAQIRRMPGRIAGETEDVDGRRGFVLALQTREQHIRREKATNNICTAQALNALGAMVHLAWLGREGFRELGELLVRAPPTPASAWPRSRGSSCCTRRRSCASSPSASTLRSPPSSTTAPSAASPPATRSAASTPSTRTASWSRSPSAARRAQIDELAEAIDGAIAGYHAHGAFASAQQFRGSFPANDVDKEPRIEVSG